jgi:flagellin
MTVINTNISALSAQQNLKNVNAGVDKAMERLSSGLRINSAADDAAGLTIVSRMEAQIRGLNQAIRNASDGISMSNTAEGAMEEIESMLQRMRELSVQAANTTYTDTDRQNLDLEVDQLVAEIDRIVGTTIFNDQKLLDGSYAGDLQIGLLGNETLNVQINNMATNALGSVSGAAVSQGITSNSIAGKLATSTKATLTFNGNDTYKFTLVAPTAKSASASFNIVADVNASNGAQDVVEKINAALRASGAPADAADTIKVSYSGRTVTIENTYGEDVKVQKTSGAEFAASGSTISFATIVGDSGSNNSVLGSNGLVKSEVTNTGGVTVTSGATTATASDVVLTGSGVTANTNFSIVLTSDGEDYSFTSGTGSSDAATLAAAFLTAATGSSSTGGTAALGGYTFATASGGGFKISRADGADFSVKFGSGNTASGATLTSDINSSVISTTALSVTDGDPLEKSSMYLDLIGADKYTFKVTDTANTATISVDYTGDAASLALAASTIKNAISNAGITNFDAEVVDGRIKITDSDSGSFKLTNFASTGDGKIAASNESGQGTSALLDDVTYATAATAVSAGVAVSTKVNLEFSTNDRFSFTISDGEATATVATTGIGAKSLAGTGTASTGSAAVTEMKAAIEHALEVAGLDDTITVSTAAVSGAPDRLILTHSLGREVSIENFKSENDGILKVEAGGSGSSASTGMTKFLDDGGASRTVISGISVSTTTDANSAIDVIDRALEDIAAERAKLGAITNRLDHTINNLGNIVVNTSASKSAIQDADFASETSNLTKSQILSQAATSMLAQANQSKQSILALLQG